MLVGNQQTPLNLSRPLENDALLRTYYGFTERNGMKFLSSLSVGVGEEVQVRINWNCAAVFDVVQWMVRVCIYSICAPIASIAGAHRYSQWGTSDVSCTGLDLKEALRADSARCSAGYLLMGHTRRTISADCIFCRINHYCRDWTYFSFCWVSRVIVLFRLAQLLLYLYSVFVYVQCLCAVKCVLQVHIHILSAVTCSYQDFVLH